MSGIFGFSARFRKGMACLKMATGASHLCSRYRLPGQAASVIQLDGSADRLAHGLTRGAGNSAPNAGHLTAGTHMAPFTAEHLLGSRAG